MEPTRRWWTVITTGVVLLVLGVVTQRSVLLYGAGGLAAWLIASTVFAGRWFLRTDEELSVDVSLSSSATRVDSTLHAILTVTRSASTASGSVDATLEVPPGVTVHGGDRTVRLDNGALEKAATAELDLGVVGRLTVPRPRVRLTDPLGLYSETLRRGSELTVQVAARVPRSIHVGQGGDQVLGAFGEHDVGRSGPGVTTRELREYVSGDPADSIDWKATARLGDVFVRETEAETDRRTAIVFDHRDRMDHGPEGETMLTYAREVAIGLTQHARDNGDPLGLWTVGEAGITAAVSPGSSPRTYSRIRDRLYTVAATADGRRTDARAPSHTRRLAGRLDAETDRFAATLSPYLDATEQYVAQVRDDPLVETVRRVRSQRGTDLQIVIVTTDSDPVRLNQAVRLATRSGGNALVFLTPRVLYEPGALADLGDVYDAYLKFEELRRDLDAHPRADAFEVAPGDRLAAILSARRGGVRG